MHALGAIWESRSEGGDARTLRTAGADQRSATRLRRLPDAIVGGVLID
jgi:hypothetical protein